MAPRSRRRIEADHDCQWRDEVEQLRGEVGELKAAVELQKSAVELQKAAVEQMRAEMESMKRRLLGPKSEKMPPIGREVRAKVGVDPAAAQAKRLANAKLRSARVVDDRCEHKVPDDQRKCPKCGHGDKLRPVGKGSAVKVLGDHTLRTIAPRARRHRPTERQHRLDRQGIHPRPGSAL
jgi:hypothetical protein